MSKNLPKSCVIHGLRQANFGSGFCRTGAGTPGAEATGDILTQIFGKVSDRIARNLRAFATDRNGAVTADAVIWIPVFIFILFLISEVSMAFAGETAITHVIDDANRLYAVGYFQSAAETEAYIRDKLPQLSSTMTVSITETNKIINTAVTVPLLSITHLNVIQQFSGITLTVSGEQLSEG